MDVSGVALAKTDVSPVAVFLLAFPLLYCSFVFIRVHSWLIILSPQSAHSAILYFFRLFT